MFGYVICNKAGLSPEELGRYRSVYCGICRTLGQKYGQLERMSLNYDMTFLALFLSALYEPEETSGAFRCAVHPMRKKSAVGNRFTEYAADMTILLSYHKCMDDWQDEHNVLKHQYAKELKRSFGRVEREYPRQSAAVADAISELARIEQSRAQMPDLAVNCSGKMLMELFVYQEDFWSNGLRKFGYELGRFVYLMDAAMDYRRDLKKDQYNPLIGMRKRPEEMEETLTAAIGNATYQFEKLPIVQDAHLLRNILYGGVWQQYYAKVLGKEKSHG